MTSIRHLTALCAESDVRYVRETLAVHCDFEFVDVAFDGERAIAVFDLGHLDPHERPAWLERAQRWMQQAISRHEVIR